MTNSRNTKCQCGSGRRYKHCCGTLNTDVAPDLTKLAHNLRTFDASNIDLLPKLLAVYLGRSFIKHRVDGYNTNGMKRSNILKYNKKFHPLYNYWRHLDESIRVCKAQKSIRTNKQFTFLIELFFLLQKSRNISGIEDVIDRFKDNDRFYSSCFELEVACYYVDLGFQVEVVKETQEHKTPDFLVKTPSGLVYVEAKLLEDKKKKEIEHLESLKTAIERIVRREKRCLKVNIRAHRELTQSDHEEIRAAVSEAITTDENRFRIRTQSGSVTIYFEKLCEWTDLFYNELPFGTDGDLEAISCIGTKLADRRIQFRELVWISTTQHVKINVGKTVKNALDNARKKETFENPLVVHVGLPYKSAEQILAVHDHLYEFNEHRISSKIAAIILQATTDEVQIDGKHPNQKHIYAIPNFESTKCLPKDFRLTPLETLDFDFPEIGELSTHYDAERVIDSLERDFVGTLSWISSHDGSLQVRYLLTPDESLRMEVINPLWGRRVFEYDFNSEVVQKGNSVGIRWNKQEITTFIDKHDLESIEVSKRS